jgi:DNA-directed RNA polymerase specialized sigma24 family protein
MNGSNLATLLVAWKQRAAAIEPPREGELIQLALAVSESGGRDESAILAIAARMQRALRMVARRYNAEAGDVLYALFAAVLRPLKRAPKDSFCEILGRVRSYLQGIIRSEDRRRYREGVYGYAHKEWWARGGLSLNERIFVRESFGRLSRADRALLVAGVAYGFDHNELAARLRTTPGAARQRLCQARKHLAAAGRRAA